MTFSHLFRTDQQSSYAKMVREHDLLDAVTDIYSIIPGNPLLLIVRRVEALGKFLDTDDGGIFSSAIAARRTSFATRRRKDKRS